MKGNINNYKAFLEKENIREDEFSHLNNNINARNFSGYDDDYDDDYGREYLNSGESRSTFRDEEYEDDVEMGDIQHLLYLLRTMFKNNGIEVEVENKNMDIMIYCIMNPKERLKDIINVFSVANKLKKDILPQYDCEFEMWETRKGKPMLTFNFYYGEGLNDDRIPF